MVGEVTSRSCVETGKRETKNDSQNGVFPKFNGIHTLRIVFA